MLAAITTTEDCLNFQAKRKVIHSAGIQPHNAYILDKLRKDQILELFQLHAEGMPLNNIQAYLEYRYNFSDDTKALARYWRRTQELFKSAEKAYKNQRRQRRQQK